MPKKVSELLEKPEESKESLRGKLLLFLKNNYELAYTLKELYKIFIDIDKKSNKLYQKNPNILYKLIYRYLWELKLKNLVLHKGNYYFYNKKYKKNGK